ncbi:MAG: hypothetical protein U0271_32125 [Polyangiaceae bacterium]
MAALTVRLLGKEARSLVAQQVARIEERTSAEVVVTVRRHADPYPEVALRVACAFAIVAFAVYVWAPITFYDDMGFAAVFLAFVAGLLFTPGFAKRYLVSAQRLDLQTARAARAAFYDQGVGETVDRTGLLLYIAVEEQRAEVVADAGLHIGARGAEWQAAIRQVRESIKKDDLQPFSDALARLGDVLAVICPLREGDRNELPDEVDHVDAS